MKKNCKQCGKEFEIFKEDQAFYKKMDVPEPNECPRCRMIQRFTFRNTRKLYYRKCDFSGEKIISQFHPDQPFPVYKPEYWWSDKWDGLDFGQDFDFKRPFFEQFLELKNKVPHQALFLIIGSSANSDFTNCTGYLKNCYLIFQSDYDQECLYCDLIKRSRDIVDCTISQDCELSYQCMDCVHCYNLRYSVDCENCSDSYFLKDCNACKNCIGCMNQRQKEFMIFNKQYTEEEYEKIKKDMMLETNSGIEKIQKKAEEFYKTQIHKNLKIEKVENSIGDHLYNSKNAFYCFDSSDLEDCRYCQKLFIVAKDCMDYNSWGSRAELVYQCSSCGDDIYNLKFCNTCTTRVSNTEYSIECTQSDSLFGCVGLLRKKYCIFNKQYSKEDYEVLKAKIIEHMKKTGEYGQFFPQSICPFGYNETLAYDHFPMTKEEALKQGFTWREEDSINKYLGPKVNIPETINEVNEDITKQILICDKCGKNYKIIDAELSFYKKMELPVPKNCPDCRNNLRLSRRNPLILWNRPCAKCGKEMKTSYAPERQEKIYCQSCYLKEVY